MAAKKVTKKKGATKKVSEARGAVKKKTMRAASPGILEKAKQTVSAIIKGAEDVVKGAIGAGGKGAGVSPKVKKSTAATPVPLRSAPSTPKKKVVQKKK